jgi:hypothetical protein
MALRAKILHRLAEALDMITICVEAGLGFGAALAKVALAQAASACVGARHALDPALAVRRVSHG